MKAGLLLLLIAVLLGGLVGTLVVRDPGYVLVAYADYAFETSLWFFVAAFVVVYLLVRVVLTLVRGAALSGGVLASWLSVRSEGKARQQTVQGLLLLGEGRWPQSRKLLTSAATRVDVPLANYLAAALAADRMGDLDGRDGLLKQAQQSTPGSRFSVGLTQAEMQRARDQWEQCLATLLRLREESPRHPLVLKLLLDCYRALGDDQAVLETLPDARKADAVTADEHHEVVTGAWCRRLERGHEPPDELWARVPVELKRVPAIVLAYAAAERQRGEPARALASLASVLKHVWDSELVAEYGRIRGQEPEQQLKQAERWLKEHPQDAVLLLTLGRLSMMSKAWPKAREYLETSLRLERSPEVYAELGRLCSALGETERGNEYLLHSLPALPDVPLPTGG